nr:hypothetical protein [uncultured Flavobacterium sp.]
MQDNGIENNMIESIAKSDLKDVAIDIAEISLDSLLKDGIAKDIPVIGSLFKLYSAGKSISGKIFEKKILAFLIETQKVDVSNKQKFYNELNADDNLKKRTGEIILVILEKIDDIEKATVLGKLFKRKIEERIDFEMFHRLATVVANTFLPDLKLLSIYKNQNQFVSFTSVSLENSGLVHLYYIKPEKFNEAGEHIDGSEYQITKLGRTLLSLEVL